MAFELMHQELDSVWQGCYRVLKEGRLAIAIVFSIIKSHEGNIDVSSKKNGGTAFSIYLSITEKEILNIKNEANLSFSLLYISSGKQKYLRTKKVAIPPTDLQNQLHQKP
jgi:hypothetical protein